VAEALDPSRDAERSVELAANLADFAVQLDRACVAAGRNATDLTVVAVTKTFPAADVRLLSGLGVADIGENRDQEAATKHAACADLPLRWHFVGRLQRNKCRSVARYADVVHSLDRPPLVEALSTAAVAAGRTVTSLIQVSLDDGSPDRGSAGRSASQGGRGGADPTDVLALADQIVAAPGLSLGGLMAVAPLGADADDAFGRLAAVAADLQARHPGATVISAGMSGDFQSAIRHGATHLRVGSALLGRRSAHVG
jgi:PLP dependent protein